MGKKHLSDLLYERLDKEYRSPKFKGRVSVTKIADRTGYCRQHIYRMFEANTIYSTRFVSALVEISKPQGGRGKARLTQEELLKYLNIKPFDGE